MEILYKKLQELFLSELHDLEIGCTYNKSRMLDIMEIINTIDYINNARLSRMEIIKILKHYE